MGGPRSHGTAVAEAVGFAPVGVAAKGWPPCPYVAPVRTLAAALVRGPPRTRPLRAARLGPEASPPGGETALFPEIGHVELDDLQAVGSPAW
jgi:hypothetical protein